MEPYWESMVFATGHSYESGSGLEFEDLPPSDEPLYLLGQSYSSLYDRDEIRSDFLSRLWITYRRDFSPICQSSGLTSDKGWGCMLRCGQMMLAEGLVRTKLGRSWRWTQRSFVEDEIYRNILKLFHDSETSLFSIHQIATMGLKEGRRIGEWFGPNTVAQAIRKLAMTSRGSFPNAAVYVAMDNAVIIDNFKALLKTTVQLSGTSQSDAVQESSTSPLFLIIPLRLGLSELNLGYVPALKEALQLPHSLGIIGGKPNHAHYFIGYQGDELIYLDPHTTQPVVDLTAEGKGISDSSYHCGILGRMPFSKLDPSIALGFVCNNESDLHDLCASLVRRVIQANPLALFEIHQQVPEHWPSLQELDSSNGKGDFSINSDEEDDEYVLI